MSAKKNLQEEVIPSVVNAIRASSGLKSQDIGFHKTVDPELSTTADNTSKRLIDIANDIMESVSNESDELVIGNDPKLQGSNWKKISNTVDTLFERMDILFDDVNRNDKHDDFKNFTYLESSNNVTKDDSRALAKKMEKPQLKFKVPIDNSETQPFKPKLSSKPNSLKPLEESVKLIQPGRLGDTDANIDNIDPPYYPHPYEFEIDNQPYPESILHETDVIPPKPFESTTAEWVDKPEQVHKLIEELSTLTEIAIDLEHHDYRSYYGLVCLMQISNREKDWIIDTLALRDELHDLNIIFTNTNIVKVFHGAFMDIIWLQRDLGLYIVSLFDTYHASRKLGFPKFSLAYLLESFAHFKTSKKYQLADWRIRPLSLAMLAYARSDTHFLLSIFDQLKNKLIKLNNNKLQEVLFDSRQVAKRRFEYTSFRPLSSSGSNLVTCPVMASNPNEPYLSIVLQFNIPYHIRPVVEVLYNWRDKMAKELDESVRFVMSNQALALLATLSKPVDAKKVLGINTYLSEPIRKHCQELATMINNTLDKLEKNDWELTHEISNETTTGSSSTNDMTPDSVSLRDQILEQIYMDNIELLSSHLNQNLSKGSSIFTKTSSFSLGTSFNNNTYKLVPIEELAKRIERKQKGFEKLGQADSSPVSVLESSKESVSDEPTESNPPEEKSLEPKEEANNEDKDEIITLRKVKKQKKNNKRSYNQDETPAFSYDNADNIMKPKENQPHKKKKTFNPYSNTGTGPKPARQPKNVHGGRSGTFKN